MVGNCMPSPISIYKTQHQSNWRSFLVDSGVLNSRFPLVKFTFCAPVNFIYSFFFYPSFSQAFFSQQISFLVRLINLDAAMPFDWQAELASPAAPAPASRLKLPRLIAPHVRPPSAPSFAQVLTSTRPKRPMIHCHNPPSKVNSSVFEFHNRFMKKELITLRKVSAGD